MSRDCLYTRKNRRPYGVCGFLRETLLTGSMANDSIKETKVSIKREYHKRAQTAKTGVYRASAWQEDKEAFVCAEQRRLQTI